MKSALIAVLVAACVLLVAFGGTTYTLRLGTMFGMYAVLALAWNIIGGFAGYPSFATGAFFGLGAYCGAILQGQGLPMYLAWVLAGVMAALFAAALGGALLRLKGHYFAVASLCVAEVLMEVTTSWTSLTGGGMGLNLPVIQMDLQSQARLFFAAMIGLALIALGINWLVSRGRLGFALRCIRQNEDASSMVGIDTTRAKIAAFTLSALPVGAAGAIYASWVFYIEPPDVYSILLSVKPIIMAMLGGAGTVLGPVVGAAIFLVMEEVVWRNFLSIHAAVLGLLIVALIFFLPNGLAGFLTGQFAKLRSALSRKEKP